MSNDRASWISPSNKIYGVEISHIKSILDNPSIYGFKNKEELLKLHKKYGEKIGFEGKAREEILLKLIEKGWVRCRYFDRDAEWHVQASRINKSVVRKVMDWASQLIIKGEGLSSHKNTPINLMGIKDGKVLSSSVGGAVKGELEESLKKMKKGLSLVENLDWIYYNGRMEK